MRRFRKLIHLITFILASSLSWNIDSAFVPGANAVEARASHRKLLLKTDFFPTGRFHLTTKFHEKNGFILQGNIACKACPQGGAAFMTSPRNQRPEATSWKATRIVQNFFTLSTIQHGSRVLNGQRGPNPDDFLGGAAFMTRPYMFTRQTENCRFSRENCKVVLDQRTLWKAVPAGGEYFYLVSRTQEGPSMGEGLVLDGNVRCPKCRLGGLALTSDRSRSSTMWKFVQLPPL